MTIFDMLEQSGILTLLGMGTVFGFLIIMVIVISLTGKLIHAAGLDKDVSTTSPQGEVGARQTVSAAAKSGTNNDAVTAAIGAAVNEYKKNN